MAPKRKVHFGHDHKPTTDSDDQKHEMNSLREVVQQLSEDVRVMKALHEAVAELTTQVVDFKAAWEMMWWNYANDVREYRETCGIARIYGGIWSLGTGVDVVKGR